MIFVSLLITALLCLGGQSAASSCCDEVPSQEYNTKIADLYLQAWNGNYSQLDSTFDPSVHIYLDRVLTGNGSTSVSVQSREEIQEFMDTARQGWDKYEFEPVWQTDGGGHILAIRWKLNGVMGAHFHLPTTLEEGEYVTYNGTDFLQLDECSKLIKQVDMAQDYITLYHNLGLSEIQI